MLKLFIYFLIVNIISFVLMGLDKQKAKKNRWRIPEKTLFLPVLLGGGIGGILGMKLFRHKTKKNLFQIGFPVVTISWFLVTTYLLYMIASNY